MLSIYLVRFFKPIPGAFFGTTFAHLFFQTYRELAPAPFWKPPKINGAPLSPGRAPRSPSGSSASEESPFENPNPHGGQKRAAGYVYTPRIYGFRVSERAKNGPRMRWLRLRPESPSELDQVDWRGRWIDEDDEYDDEEEDDEDDRQMEDFDPVSLKQNGACCSNASLRMPLRARRKKRKRRRKRRKRREHHRTRVDIGKIQSQHPRRAVNRRRRIHPFQRLARPMVLYPHKRHHSTW